MHERSNELDLLADADRRARDYVRDVNERRVFPDRNALQALEAFDERLPDEGRPADETIAKLDTIGSPATTASNGPHYFGFVIGASLPVAAAADRLALAWDQCASSFDNSPAGVASDSGSLKWNNEGADGVGQVNPDWWETKQDYFNRAFEKPGFLDVGLVVDTDKVGMVFLLDIRQDTFQHFKDNGGILTNIPFVGAIVDLNFPRVGYVDYTSGDGSFYRP